MLSKRLPTQRFTYGLGGTSILAALFNAAFLLVIIGGLSWEAIGRFWNPQPVAGKTVMIVAGVAVSLLLKSEDVTVEMSSGSRGRRLRDACAPRAAPYRGRASATPANRLSPSHCSNR